MVDDDLLELRVHGVNNTPPVSLLYAIKEEYGDSLVGVYGQRSNGWLVRGFSWGGLARLSPIPRIPFANWVQALGSAAWIFVMPFGLANVAYWSRRLKMPGEQLKTARATAALARVFSLGLTLLLVSSVCSVSLDMAERRVLVEKAPLPTWLSWLRDIDAGDRMAIFSLAPLLSLLLLYALARWSKVTYDWGKKVPPTAPNQPAKPAVAPPEVWKVGSRNFWDNADLSAHNAAVHTAAGVALTLMWTGQIWFQERHRVGVAVVVLSSVIVIGCLILIASMPLVTDEKSLSTTRKVLAWFTFGSSIVLFAIQEFALASWHPLSRDPTPLAGLSFVPGALVFTLLVLAVSALGWRWWRRLSYAVAALPIFGGAVALALHQWKVMGANELKLVDSLLSGAAAIAAAAWLWWLYRRDRRHHEEAWHGTAPGLLMVLALFAAVLLSTVFVMAAATLLGDGKIRINEGEVMTAPPIYLSFASMLVPVVASLILLVVVVLLRTVLFCRNPIEPQLDVTTEPDAEEMARLAAIFDATANAPWWARALRLGRMWRLGAMRCRTRRLASTAHRAEPMAAVFCVIAALALCGGLAVGVLLHNGTLTEDDWILPHLRGWGVGLAVVVGGLIAGMGTARGRPLGIVWDLICFLPRAAHPFGPPCYAQRAVPELLNYCRAWLDTPIENDALRQRRLILSAHSLGGVLAASIVLLLGDVYRSRIALLTYGCQLRAYFGRIFPELLGPPVLGVTNSRPAGLLGCPTFGPASPSVSSDENYPASVRDTLQWGGVVRWVNLWRPTDYLGFPVYSREPGNPIDRPADEVTAEESRDGKIVRAADETDLRTLDEPVPMSTSVRFAPTTTVRVDAHSDYFRARQYPAAVIDLRDRMA